MNELKNLLFVLRNSFVISCSRIYHMTIKHTSQDKILSEASQYFEHILFERDTLIKNLSTINSNYKVVSIREIMEYDLQLDKTYKKCFNYPDNECHKPPFSRWETFFDNFHKELSIDIEKGIEISDSKLLELYYKRVNDDIDVESISCEKQKKIENENTNIIKNDGAVVSIKSSSQNKGGRPKDPDLPKRKIECSKKYYILTTSDGLTAKKAHEILAKEYNKSIHTIETWLKTAPTTN